MTRTRPMMAELITEMKRRIQYELLDAAAEDLAYALLDEVSELYLELEKFCSET